jgi:hypothetical protein
VRVFMQPGVLCPAVRYGRMLCVPTSASERVARRAGFRSPASRAAIRLAFVLPAVVVTLLLSACGAPGSEADPSAWAQTAAAMEVPVGTGTPGGTSSASPTETAAAPTGGASGGDSAGDGEDRCGSPRLPGSFQPSSIPDVLLQIDTAILDQPSQRTETDVSRIDWYGAASYGYESHVHYTCWEDLQAEELLSYCRFERERTPIHIYTGEPRGTPDRMVDDSLLRGIEAWVRPEGGAWYHSRTLDLSDAETIRNAYRISPFFFEELDDCETEADHPGLESICFRVSVPRFFREVYTQDVSTVDCVYHNQGIAWFDPETSLPRQVAIHFFVSITYEGQEDEKAYNVVVDWSQEFLEFGEQYTYPDPEG